LPVSDLFSLAGKVAIVSGGSRGLGKQMALALAEAGARVAISARREQWLTPTAEEFAAAGHECLALTCDVSQPDQVTSFVHAVVERYGQIDVLFNNAGISWGAASVEMPVDRWRQVMEVNATGAFLMSQAVARTWIPKASAAAQTNPTGGPTVEEDGVHKIINVSSIMGLRGQPPETISAAGYSASKGALIALTKALAVEWAPHNVTVNALAPGFFPTRLSEGVISEHEDAMLERIPLRRFGSEQDISGVAVFLASAASDYITGQVIVLDGGTTAL
jgi:NAD(P)-dependent dehydrogenase (short-subunit alcohol dehydrogenase family)